jgi:ParB family chromosome partitioning protein
MPWTPPKPDLSPVLGPDQADFFNAKPIPTGEPLLAPIELLEEDPGNPRTEFPEGDLAELAADIGAHGILQPIVVRGPASDGRYRILFGAKRLRAAKLAGLREVPVVIGTSAHDVYAQVAENQKRHGLSPLDLARFMRSRVDAGESNAEIARRMGIDQTTVAHHLALLTLPPELNEAFRSGRCTSPKTLYELVKLHDKRPEQVKAIVAREGEITRSKVAALKAPRRPARAGGSVAPVTRRKSSLSAQAEDLCRRLESLVARMTKRGAPITPDELATLRRRLADLAAKQSGGSDGPTPPNHLDVSR